MKWNIDINEMNKVSNDLKQIENLLEEFFKTYNELIQELSSINGGEFIETVRERVEKEFDDGDAILLDIEDIYIRSDKYLQDITQTNPWSGSGRYKVDTHETNWAYKRGKSLLGLDGRHFIQDSRRIRHFKDDFVGNISAFYIVDDQINIHVEYKGKEEEIRYIEDQRIKIREDIRNYNSNEDILNDVNHRVKSLKNKFDNMI